MKRGLLLIGIIFAITLAVIFGFRVSADALAVIVGVVLGIMASIPTTLLVIFVITRQQSRLEKATHQMPQHPPVVVVNAADRPQPYSSPALPAPQPMNNTRKWTVVGDIETDSMEVGD